jgi:hypothetical protein
MEEHHMSGRRHQAVPGGPATTETNLRTRMVTKVSLEYQ